MLLVMSVSSFFIAEHQDAPVRWSNISLFIIVNRSSVNKQAKDKLITAKIRLNINSQVCIFGFSFSCFAEWRVIRFA